MRQDDVLVELGYDITYRQDTWFECLLSREGESWLGLGTDRAGALEHAVRQAFPSHGARELLRRACAEPARDSLALGVGADDAAPGLTTGEPEGVAPEVAPADVTVAYTSAVPLAPGIGALTAPAPPTAPSEPPRQADHAHAGDAWAMDTEPEAGREEAEPAREAAPAPERAGRPAASVNVGALITNLEAIWRSIEEGLPEAALSTPARQRLLVTIWIAKARAQEEQAPTAKPVWHAVHQIARKLGDLCRQWWPGSVRALRKAMSPAEAWRDLPDEFRGGEVPLSWRGLAECAERVLDTVKAADSARGMDDFGWADAAALAPAPESSEEMLAEIERSATRAGGPLDEVPAEGRPPNVEAYEDWAMKARWLRGSSPSPDRWARVVGRLRYWCLSHPALMRSGRLLDPEYVPERTWPEMLALVAERERRARELEDLLCKPFAPETDAEGRLAWLRRAFALDGEWPEPIVEALRPFRDWVESLDESSLGADDRRGRRRLARLRDLLAGRTPDADEGEGADGVEATEEATEEGEGEEDAERAGGNEGYSETELSEMRARTEGLRAIFVTNREDARLEQKILDLLRLRSVKTCLCDPRRVQSVCQSISSGACDVVLAATGFMPHKQDVPIRAACRKAGVTFVNVGKGRPGACVKALLAAGP